MEAVCTSVILLILCISDTCTSDSEPKAQERLLKGIECGISASAPNGGRIVGGDEARPHSWPWQAFIICPYYMPKPAKERMRSANSYCGGSIITDKWVITAAHCVVERKAGNGTFNFLNPEFSDRLTKSGKSNLQEFATRGDCHVRLGKHDIRAEESTQVVVNISRYVLHNKYHVDIGRTGYDLALLQLEKPLKFTNAIKPICLPFGLPELPFHKVCYATGWGRTQFDNQKKPGKLKQLPMTIQKDLYCKDTRDAVGRIICGGRYNRGEDVCKGDSGGPLSCKEHGRKWYLRGLLSRGATKCDSTASFTKIVAFEEWITNIISHY